MYFYLCNKAVDCSDFTIARQHKKSGWKIQPNLELSSCINVTIIKNNILTLRVVSASDEAALRQRNQHVKSIDEDGLLTWKRTSGYYRQSEVENMFFRYKKLIGDELRARNENSRRVESVIACNILNRLKLLGSPQSELIAWRPNQKTDVIEVID